MSVANIVKTTAKLERRLEALRDRVRKLEQVLSANPGMLDTAKDFFSILKSTKYRRQLVKVLKNIDLIMDKLEELDIRISIIEEKLKDISEKLST